MVLVRHRLHSKNARVKKNVRRHWWNSHEQKNKNDNNNKGGGKGRELQKFFFFFFFCSERDADTCAKRKQLMDVLPEEPKKQCLRLQDERFREERSVPETGLPVAVTQGDV